VRDERSDAVLYATDALIARLKKVREVKHARAREQAAALRELGKESEAAALERREANNCVSLEPAIADIGVTHVNPFVRSWRPHVISASEYFKGKIKSNGHLQLSEQETTVTFTLPAVGHFTSDIVAHVRIGAVAEAVTNESASLPNPASPDSDFRLRWCAYPGLRMFKEVEFTSDGTLIDRYSRDAALLKKKFFVDPAQRDAYDRMHGQGQARTALCDNYGGYLQYHQFNDGPQAPKYAQPAFDMWVPLKFDFCSAPDKALVTLPNHESQREVTFKIAPIGELLKRQVYAGLDDLVDSPLLESQKRVSFQISLYANNIFVAPEVHALYIKRMGTTLIRVHREQRLTLDSAVGEKHINEIKSPGEYLMLGARLKNVVADFDQWHLFGYDSRASLGVDYGLLTFAQRTYVPVLGIIQLTGAYARAISDLDPLVTQIGLKNHGVSIFPLRAKGFYSDYLPGRYGERGRAALTSPEDSNALLLPFCLWPGAPETDGTFNFSGARESYLEYAAPLVNAGNLAELIVVQSGINFLVDSGDSLALRYAL